MVKFCPSCGAKVKEGSKFCLSCGAQLQKEIHGGQPTQTIPNQVPPYQQPIQQHPYGPITPKKPKKGLIIALIAIITIVIVVVIVVLLLGGTLSTLSGDASKFVGTWEYDFSGYFTYDMKFNSDKSLEYGMSGYSIKVGTWDVQNNKLVMEITASGTDLSSQEYDYEFSSDGNTVTLSSDGYDIMTLTKK